MKTGVGTIISYCTNDFRFIGRCIEEAAKFSEQIIVVVCDHFFDGSAENRDLLQTTYANHPNCLFLEVAYSTSQIYSRFHTVEPSDADWPAYWAATMRYIGFYYLREEIQQILFLDSDEIVEGERFLETLASGMYRGYNAIHLAAYYYVLRASLRAKTITHLPLLVNRQTLAPLTLVNPLERIGAYLTHPKPKRNKGLGVNGRPLVHHYSWVRTKEECYQKTRTWSHRSERDWPSIIENTFANRQYFIDECEFEEISDVYFDPLGVSVLGEKKTQERFSHVICIDERSFFKRTIEFL